MSGADPTLETRLARALARVAQLEQELAEARCTSPTSKTAETAPPRTPALTDREAEALRDVLITRLQVAVDDAERSRVQLEAVFEAVNDGIAVADMSGQFVLMNEAEATLSGYASPAEMLRDLTYFTEVFELRGLDEALLPLSEWPITRVLRGESLHDVVLHARRRDTGQSWYFSFSAEPVRDDTGRQVLAVVITRDVTERRRAVDELRAAHERLQQADACKDEFLAVLSHELRNPLSAIKNSAHLLDRAAPGSEVARRARTIIDRQVGHLARLVDDLLDATRITSNKIRLQRRVLDLRELVRDAVEDQRPGFDAGGLHLGIDLPAAPVLVDADPERLAQVVGNLLHNAAKFANPGGRARVCLSVDTPRARALLEVADDGIGMTPHTLERLFMPFMQADTSLDRSKGGLGLGLALVKTLVELHDGEVSAHSDGLGRGSRLHVQLPLAPPAPVVVDAPGPEATGVARRVLIVEDNVDAAELLRDLLELDGHTIALAFSGPEGLTLARNFRPEVVLCDIGLPAMDGYSVAAAMRAEPLLADTCLIALSGYALPDDVRRATAAGFDHHIAKPPDLDRLASILRSPGLGRA